MMFEAFALAIGFAIGAGAVWLIVTRKRTPPPAEQREQAQDTGGGTVPQKPK